MRVTLGLVTWLPLLVRLAGCGGGDEPSTPGAAGRVEPIAPVETADDFAVIADGSLSGGYREIPYYGDLWATTWADDDRLYMMFGDGTGMA